MTISSPLRRAVTESGLKPLAVAKAAGVSPAVLSRWLNGHRDITLATADKIAAGLRLACTLTPAR